MGEERPDYSISVDELWEMWGRRLRATPRHEAAVNALLDLYRGRGLLPGDRDLTLTRCCPHCQECWRDTSPPVNLHDSGIALPWVGKRYFETRIVILGINLDNVGGLAANYWVCEDHIRSMGQGKRGKANLPFSRNAMLSLRLVLARRQGNELPADEATAPNESLADLWEQCAFLEAIKCSPDTDRSYPTEAMFANCPEFLVKEELEILEPSVILLFGRTHLRDVVRLWAVPEDGYGFEEGKHLERNRALIRGRPATLFSLNHPSSQNSKYVTASLGQLRESLSARPL